ncbi:hypothetical protein PQX77_000895 [Marasmius sp. AFHP31]|nr:hypothetical protein PQX77_000895 [Marasmius sp. AFHP31]
MKKSKAPTPQELYRSRKQQEEQEKQAYLPPGLINHGNTCFMNSVLQGLIATRLLSNLILFEPIPLDVQHHSNNALVSQRSPQLTNGHTWAGVHQRDRVEGMPIGDVFVNLMQRAWGVQRNRSRESLSPRQLLMTLGSKYDQYLDFAQQDAHEFLRILLDAMRMEEFDVIKKRQPPAARRTIRRRTTIIPARPSSVAPHPHANDTQSPQSQPSDPQTSVEDELPLMSFSDMLFGGRLTSVLVCQKCKHISHTYEDFNDLSLSIKAEDYAKEKKRDRLKKLAKKMGMGLGRSGTLKPGVFTGSDSPSGSPEARVVSAPVPQQVPVGLTVDASAAHNSGLRSSSVPPSPSPMVEYQEPPLFIDSRRRSVDNIRPVELDEAKRESDSDDGELVVVEHSEPPTPDERKIEFAKDPDREDKAKKGWSEKLGRRLSMTVGGLGRSGSVKDKEKDKEKRRSRSRTRTSNDGAAQLIKSSTSVSSEVSGPEIRLSPPTTTLSPNRRRVSEEIPRGDLDETIRPNDRGKPRAHSDVSEDGKLNMKEKISTPAPQAEISSLIASSSASLPKFPNIQRAKSPKPPKPSRAETEYLRQILADVTTSSSHNFPHFPGFSNGSAPSNGASPSSPPANNTWFMKLGLPLPSVEECLKMFTAVEVLDGENMVGCRTCWKIANGCYEPRAGKINGKEEDGDDSDDEDDTKDEPLPLSPVVEASQPRPSTTSFVTTETTSSSSTATTTPATSVTSLPSHNRTPSASDPELRVAPKGPRPPLSLLRSQSQGLPNGTAVPIISTTDTSLERPISPSPLTARPNGIGSPSLIKNDTTDPKPPHSQYTLPQSTDSKESLLSIPTRRSRKNSASDDGLISTTEDESSDPDSDVSQTVSFSSSVSSAPSSASSIAPNPHPVPKPKKSKPPKPTIMRPAFKRYLIATPPPILVIHLKRFQQISKTPIPMMSFSSGFKKLDDYVAFPEHLDLTPFLAPKKEDFGLGKRGAEKVKDLPKERRKDKERCVYRLYAVVVHIGHMLGGHYIAYTALPQEGSVSGSTRLDDELKGPPAPRQWAYISDTVVRLTTLEEVLKAKAYICLYERV